MNVKKSVRLKTFCGNKKGFFFRNLYINKLTICLLEVFSHLLACKMFTDCSVIKWLYNKRIIPRRRIGLSFITGRFTLELAADYDDFFLFIIFLLKTPECRRR